MSLERDWPLFGLRVDQSALPADSIHKGGVLILLNAENPRYVLQAGPVDVTGGPGR